MFCGPQYDAGHKRNVGTFSILMMNSILPGPLKAPASTLIVAATFAVLILWPTQGARATVIGIDPGPAPTIASEAEVSFDDLDGTALLGQNISLDFTWTGGKFIRLFSSTNPSFATLLTLQTSGSGLVGYLDGTAFLVDQNSNQLGETLDLGSASKDDGSITAGFSPLLSAAVGTPLTFYGIHFELHFEPILPDNASLFVTGGTLDFRTAGAGPNDRFGIGPGVPADIVPDSGATFILLGLSLAALLATKSWSRSVS